MADATLNYARLEPPGSPTWRFWGTFCRVLVGLVFLVAALGKIADPLKFAEEIQGFQMVPDGITHVMAFLLPWLEAVCALLLITGFWRREARVVVLALLAIFVAAKGWALYLGLHINCGCFGSWLGAFDKATQGWPGVILNLGLISALLVSWVADCRTSGRGPTTPINQ